MIHSFSALPSTQDEMKRMISTGEARPLDAVLAGIQTGGRGRLGRQWESPRGNLAASIYLRAPAFPLTWVPHWIGVSVLRALESLGVDNPGIRLKWPNDVVWESRAKLGGILCETAGAGVIVGIGLNLAHAPEVEGREIESFARALGRDFSEEFARELLEHILRELAHEPAIEELKTRYEARALFRTGEHVSWEDPVTGAKGSGTVLSLGEHGELLVETRESGTPAVRALFGEEVGRVRG